MESTLSSAIGAFVGVIGVFIIARWQMNKSQRLSNIPFFIKFNNAQLYINRFDEKVEKILAITQGEKRAQARILLIKHDFIELKENIERAIKEINSDISEADFKNFVEDLGSFNKDAPVAY